MPESLYDHDALAWSEEQAGLLRRVAAGERLNDAVDWGNVIEEVEAVGLSELHACESLLVQALTHLLKLRMWPDSRAVSHWRGETAGFLAAVRRRYAPSMRRRIAIADLYADALYELRERSDDSGAPQAVAAECPFSLDDFLAERPDVSALIAKLQAG